jgi:hypothetical protein
MRSNPKCEIVGGLALYDTRSVKLRRAEVLAEGIRYSPFQSLPCLIKPKKKTTMMEIFADPSSSSFLS